jgi:ABC-type sugar transport system ATPase subunit
MTNRCVMLEAEGLSKLYGGVAALKGVDFHVRASAVHALVGENGAGKSTLVKLLAGALAPDAGVLRLNGQEVRFTSTADAAAHGIAVVSQELSLFPDLDVLANLFPMRELRQGPFVARARMAELAQPVMRELGLDIDLRAPVASLSLEQCQLLEIARALIMRPRVLILDEPTSALHVREKKRLHDALLTLRQREVAVVYISHILEDVLSLCDEVTVLRDGECVLRAALASSLSLDEVVRAMLGAQYAQISSQDAGARAGQHLRGSTLPQEEVQQEKTDVAGISDPKKHKATGEQRLWGQDALCLEHVTIAGRLEDVTLEVPKGVIVGVTGLSGSGYRDILAVVSGLLQPERGYARLPDGKRIDKGLRRAVQQGVALVSGDRRRIGLMLDKPLWDNIAQVRAIALCRDGVFIQAEWLRKRARIQIARLGMNTQSVDQEVGELSGGNQQKIVFARWFEAEPSILLLDDPTRGIDIGAKAEIYRLIHEQAQRGAVQVLASTDPWELSTICDRVFVFYNGRICATLEPPHLTAHRILEVMNTGEMV